MYNSYYPYPNVLPAQQILQANGKASVDAIKMSPNSSVLIMDSTAPLIWLCVSDGLGNVTKTAYDISEHKEVSPVDSLEQRLTAIEQSLNQIMGEMNNAKSNAPNAKSKQAVRSNGADTAD